MLNVDQINDGIVIDHIKAGTGVKIYHLLHLEKSSQSVALLQSVHSEKYGKKDLIKIEGLGMPKRLEILGYLDPNITLIEIRGGRIVKKYRPEIPKKLVNVIRCKNPRCITSVEPECDQIFELTDAGIYRCAYCNAEYHF